MSNKFGNTLQEIREKWGTSAWEMGYDDFAADRW
jgi:hypothetical protein